MEERREVADAVRSYRGKTVEGISVSLFEMTIYFTDKSALILRAEGYEGTHLIVTARRMVEEEFDI